MIGKHKGKHEHHALPLYHFTCDHGHAGISKTGILRPSIHPLMAHLGPLLWLTDLAVPTPEAVGLTHELTTCDRLQYRYIVHTRSAVSWDEIRQRAPREVVEALESFGEPSHWWVVRRPVLASEFALDQNYRQKVQAG